MLGNLYIVMRRKYKDEVNYSKRVLLEEEGRRHEAEHEVSAYLILSLHLSCVAHPS